MLIEQIISQLQDGKISCWKYNFQTWTGKLQAGNGNGSRLEGHFQLEV